MQWCTKFLVILILPMRFAVVPKYSLIRPVRCQLAIEGKFSDDPSEQVIHFLIRSMPQILLNHFSHTFLQNQLIVKLGAPLYCAIIVNHGKLCLLSYLLYCCYGFWLILFRVGVHIA